MRYYFFYLDSYYEKQDGVVVWRDIHKTLTERFGEPTVPGHPNSGRWSPSLTNYYHSVPRGVYFMNSEDALAFSLTYNEAVLRPDR